MTTNPRKQIRLMPPHLDKKNQWRSDPTRYIFLEKPQVIIVIWYNTFYLTKNYLDNLNAHDIVVQGFQCFISFLSNNKSKLFFLDTLIIFRIFFKFQINSLKLFIKIFSKVIYPAMTAFTDQYSLPNIFFDIGQL